MKSLIFRSMLAAAAFCLASAVTAQEQNFGPQWGENATQEERFENVKTWNFFEEAYKNKNYDQAVPLMLQLIEKVPASMNNLYVYGIGIYRNKIARARSIDERNQLVDSLMWLYDKRIENFGSHPQYGRPYILKYKSRDYLTYRPADRENVKKYLREAIDANASTPDLGLINIYFKELTDDYAADVVMMDEVVEEYDRLSAYFDADTTPEGVEARTTFDGLFVASGAASCESLEQLYRERIATAPDDADLYAKAFAMLNREECDSPFFMEVGEKLYQLRPSVQTAMSIASAYERKSEFDKASQYLRKAVAEEADPVEKANLCVRIAGAELSARRYSMAADFARQAIAVNPQNGFAYIFLAQSYAAGATSCAETFDQQTVYWLAYDALLKARSLFADDETQLKTVEQLMSSYRGNFPSKEECFFRSLSDGMSFTVRCGWISGTTTVREGK